MKIMDSSQEQLIVKRPPRPRIISLLAIVFLLVGAAGVYRVLWFAFHWDYILQISQPFSWWFALNGSLWVAASTWLTGVWLWSGHPRAIITYWLTVSLFIGLYWSENWLLTPHNWSISVFSSIVSQFIWVLVSVFVFRSEKVRKYYSRR